MKAIFRVGEMAAATLLLLAPVIWNGFPFLQYDSGGYLARWFEGYLVPSRSTVYGLHLLLFAPASLSRRESAGLVLLVGFAGATHSATLAVLMAIVAAAGLARLYRLEDHCPDARLRLCPYRHRLPRTADEFLWSKGPFDEFGRFAGLGEEMRTIVLESLAEYPGMQIETSVNAAARQLVKVESGEGVLTTIWHTYGIIERYLPSVVPAMRAARQQHGEVSFRSLNDVQVPVALISMLLLPVILLAGRGEYGDLRRSPRP
jgi:hypothetical protein